MSASPRVLALAAAAITAAVFARAVQGGFVYDDELLIARNPLVTAPEGLRDLLARPLWGDSFWRPLTSLVLWAGYHAGGGGPAVLHATAVALHAAATLGAFALAHVLTRRPAVAFAAALLFGLHPVQVESVAWATSIDAPLWGCFGLWACQAHVRWRERGARGAPWRAVLCFAAALLAKEPAVAVLPAILVLDLARAGWSGVRVRMAAAHAPLLATLLAYAALRVAVLGDLFADNAAAAADLGVAPARLWSLRVELLGWLVQLLCAPVTPGFFRAVAAATPWSDPRFLLHVACALAAGAAFGIACARRKPGLLIASGFVLAALAPSIAWLPHLGLYPAADRHLYFAAFGAAFGAALLLQRLAPRARRAALCVIALACAAADVARIGEFADQETLVATEAARHPDDARVQYMLGQALLERQMARPDPAALAAARAAFDRARELLARPRYAQAAVQRLIATEVQIGQAWCELLAEASTPPPRRATARFAALAAAHPDSANAHIGWGVALAQDGRLQEAHAALARAVALAPDNPVARHNLALVLQLLGRDAEAGAERAAEQRLRPR